MDFRVLHRTRYGETAAVANAAWSEFNAQDQTTDEFPRALPDFVIIGAQRCGTSALYDMWHRIQL